MNGWSNDVGYWPFVGPQYGTQSERLLIVGEGHHGFGPDDDNATLICLDDWRNGRSKRDLQYFTRVARTLTGQQAYEIARETAYNDSAFYNYSQAAVLNGHATDWETERASSQRAFQEVLSKLAPTHIVFTGIGKLWRTVSESSNEKCVRNLAGKDVPIVAFRNNGHLAIGMATDHMTRGSPKYWYPVVRAFRELEPHSLYP